MTKKEETLVEDLKNKMPQFAGSKVEIEKKIAMFLYLYIGTNKVFDERYFLGNDETQKRIIRNNTRDLLRVKKNEISNGEEDPIIDNKVGVCETIANLYERLLNDFGIKAKMVKTGDETNCVGEGKEQEHASVVIYFSNGETILANPQEDLSNIQTHSKTVNFGTRYDKGIGIGEKMPDAEILELHKACGYVKDETDYMDSKIEALARKVSGMTPTQILEQIVNDEQINNYQKDIGYIELYKHYIKVIKSVASRYAQNGINYFNCYKESGEEQDNIPKREYSMCIYSTYNNNVNEVYLYSNKSKRFGKIELEKLRELQENGLHLGKNNSEMGKKVLERALRKLNTKEQKSK